MITQLLHASQWCYQHHFNKGGVFFEKLMILTCSAHISGQAKIAKNVSFSHGGIGVVVNPACETGEGSIINVKVTLGNRYPHPGAPKLGKNVYVGSGAYIGGIQIADNVMIGANSVVLKDIPSGCIAVGNPARILPKKDNI